MEKSQPDIQKMDSANGNKIGTVGSDNPVVDIENEVFKTREITDKEFFDKVSHEEKKFYEDNPSDIENMSIQCTACWKQVNHHIKNSIVRHPLLGVPICRYCKNFYGEEDEWDKDEEGFDCYCRWCGNGGDLICCDSCTKSFCKRCVQRNKGRSKVSEISNAKNWECFSCCPSQIYDIRALGYAIFKWSSTSQVKEQERSAKKRLDKSKKAKENQKEMNEQKEKVEMDKIENFIDENISEAFDTLGIYQKYLEVEKKKWLKSRKSVNANNAAVTARSLRRIYSITKQNMELLDTALVQAYGGLFPEENKNKLNFSKTSGGSKTPTSQVSLNKTPLNISKKKKFSAKLNFNDTEENEETEHQNGIGDQEADDNDTANQPETKETANVLSEMKPSINGNKSKCSSKSGEKLKVSTNLFRKSPAQKISKQNKKRPLPIDGDKIEEITIESDESDSDTDSKRKKMNSLSDFDVSFSFE